MTIAGLAPSELLLCNEQGMRMCTAAGCSSQLPLGKVRYFDQGSDRLSCKIVETPHRGGDQAQPLVVRLT